MKAIPAAVLLSFVIASPAWADRIAVTSLGSVGTGIATVDPDTGSRKALTARGGYLDSEPAWSPDGKRIAFARSTDGRRSMRIWVMRADGSRARRITAGRFDGAPAWSPDGRRLVYQSATGLRTVRPDGSGSRAVPGAGEGAYSASWSPDGKRLAYSSGNAVYVQRVTGGARRRLGRGREPDWSPDGAQIAFTGPDGGVFVMRADGRGRRMLGKGMEPVWSPDGKRVAFTRWTGVSDFSVWVMRPDGTGARRVARNVSAPDWLPVP